MSNQKLPQIRFKVYNNEWNYTIINNLCKITTGTLNAEASVENGKYEFFTCNQEVLKTDTYAFDGDAILINGNGQLGFTRKFSGKFNAYQRTYVLTNFNRDFNYIEQVIKKYLPNKINSEALGGAMPYIKVDTISKLKVPISNNTEESDLSKLLSYIDNVIYENEILYQKYKALKKSMLESIFPSENKTIPKLRFNNFTDTWEQHHTTLLTYYLNASFNN